MTDNLKLTARKNKVTEKLLENEEKLVELLDGLGSPLNIVLPESIEENIEGYQEVYENHRISGKIFLAHKANKSEALIREAEHQGICLDVASINELENALNNGFTGDRIECTGPKNKRFLELALKHGCSIHVDNFTELEQIERLHNQLGLENKVRIQVRMVGFMPKDRDMLVKDNKFGIPINKKDRLIDEIKSREDILEFEGLAFHLVSSNIREKVTAIDNVFDIFEEFQEAEITPKSLNIGGSQRVNYLESSKEWSEYKQRIKKSLKGEAEPVTWNGQGFGYKVHGDQVVGAPNLYDYYNETAKTEYLDKLLKKEVPSRQQTVAELLRQYMIELYIEPGRSLYDQAGVTLAKVNFVKESLKEEKLVGLDMNMTNLNTNNWELMTDPVVINRKERDELDDGVYFTGNLCLENDMIYNHKTFLDKGIEEDDLVVFLNTAAYHMDFGEARTIQKPLAEKVAVTVENGFKWVKDDKYSKTTEAE